ncbi:MAG: DUF835 domain-containing protein [Thermoplasmata archaeon]|nr:DUF835 domain-containing protein [Thermoplasmata archaeon]MCI4340943.1 DUF835 domain-containing protein [Thermoplasmata archaeon]
MLGGVELDSSASLDRSWDQFLARTRDGASGLWVGRVFPPALRAASGSADIRFLWLSAANRPNSVRPTDLEALEGELLAATEQHRVSAVILQELEYLVTVNGVEPVARWLRRLQSHSRRLGVTVWMPVNPELLPGGDLEPLEQALASPG